MGHVVMTSELSGVPEHEVLRIEQAADPMRKAIFAFSRKVSREPASVTRADVDALRPYLNDAQIVELVFAICRYNTMNRLADAFGVPLETENVFAPAPEPKEPPSGYGSSGLEGVVNGVRGNLVGISVGSADKVKLGDIFSLSRGGQYVGQIVITSVDKNQSVGEFDQKFPGSGAPPQKGDKATLQELEDEARPPQRYGRSFPEEGAPGVVSSVKGNLVSISVGSDDKVKLGDVYSLSRGGQYVGRIIITSVDKKVSVGEFDERFPGSGAPPQEGDKASPGGLD
jgi:hypothetical protein